MRILVVSHNYPRFSGDPAGAYVARLAQAARVAGAELRVVTPHTPGTPVDQTDDGIPVHRFRYAPSALERIGYRGDVRRRALFSPLRLLVLPAYVMAFRRAVRRAVRDFAPDLIHAHWWLPGGWVAAGAGKPFLVTCHGSDIRLLDRSAFYRRLAQRVLSQARAVTTVSRFLAAELARHLPSPRRPVSVLPMPIDAERFAAGGNVPKAQPARILYAGNLLDSKGVDVLLRAFAILRERGIACALKVLGEGPARAKLQGLAATLGVAEATTWSDFVRQEAMPAEYGASTITVLPTRGQAEGLGLTLVEALLAGSAVVGTPAGGIPEVVVDGETGLLARDGDPQHLADQLARLLTDPALRTRLAEAGARFARETYAAAVAARPFLQLYDAVAHDYAAR